MGRHCTQCLDWRPAARQCPVGKRPFLPRSSSTDQSQRVASTCRLRHLPADGTHVACKSAQDGRGSLQTSTSPDLVVLVETSMLAAISGLLYLITATLGIDGSFLFSYMLPCPIVVASARRGHGAAWSTMGISASLVLVLLGPLRALSYILSHGLATAVLGSCWALGVQWQWSILLMSAAKVACQAASLALASLTVGENLLSIAISTIGVYLDKAGLMMGTNATANITYNFLLGAFLCSLALNSLLKACMTHVVYYIMLKTMKYDVPDAPRWLRKAVLPQST